MPVAVNHALWRCELSPPVDSHTLAHQPVMFPNATLHQGNAQLLTLQTKLQSSVDTAGSSHSAEQQGTRQLACEQELQEC